MKVTFWGVRGSIATPGQATAEFGGNTSCVELQTGNEHFIFDCGTGIRELGRSLAASGAPVNVNILLTHSHWDHIQGFPFFAPAFGAGNGLTIYGPQEHTMRLSETLAGQMQYRYFPIGLEQLAAEIKYHELREEQVSIGSAVVSTHYLNHTLMAIAYKVEANGRSVIFATDTEPFSQHGRAWESSENRKFMHKGDEELAQFFSGADVLIIDTQYTANEYPGKLGWGHATPDYALDLAISAGVGTVVLFHHDPTRIDTAVAVLEQLAQNRAREEAPNLEVLAAAEGLNLTFEEQVSSEMLVAERRLPEFHPRVRIAAVGAREEFMRVAWKALAQDYYEMLAVNALNTLAGDELTDFDPHLVLLEYGLEGWDPSSGPFIERARKENRPVIAVVPAGQFEYAQEAFEHGASDVLIEPFAPTQLRSRVDSWLMRSGVAVDRRVRMRTGAAMAAPVDPA